MKVVYFDTQCFYCNSFIIMIIHKTKDISVAGLNHSRVSTFLDKNPKLDSVVYEEDGEFYIKSTAIFLILMQMGWLYKLVAAIYWLVPKPLRDWEYDQFAKYRYKLAFGETCRNFTEEEKARFLDLD